jgi:hypothetical protein
MGQRSVKIDEYLQYLRDNCWFPDCIRKKARDMTRAEARDYFVYELSWGTFQIRNRDELFSIGKNGEVVPPAPDRKVTIYPSVIDGVSFRYLTHITKKGGKKTVDQTMGNLDMRLIAFLCRLCWELRVCLGVNTIYHIGFLFEKERNDCHGQGRALDFAGAAGEGFDMTVAEHWSGQPVTMLKDWKKTKAGTKLDDWPSGDFTDTYFRLDSAYNTNLKPELDPETAANLFRTVYEVATDECMDTNTNATATTIGKDSSYILHPDYRKSVPHGKSGREAHWQHMHMQIGPTGTELNAK